MLTNLSPELLTKGLGILVLIFVIYRLLEYRLLKKLVYQARSSHAILAGSVAGFVSTFAHSGGPPITIYLMMQQLRPETFIATSALFFAVLNWIKVPYYYVAGMFDFYLLLNISPFAILTLLGVWAGQRVVTLVDKRLFDAVIIALLFATGVFLLLK